MAGVSYTAAMKTVALTVRVPQRIAADIARESRKRNISKSDVVRERLDRGEKPKSGGMLALIEDLIVADDTLPRDLSSRVDYYLKKTGFGRAKMADYGKARR